MIGSTDVGAIYRQREARLEREATRSGGRTALEGYELELYLERLELKATDHRLRQQHPYHTVYIGHPAGPRAVRLPCS
jgi:hypothetical protein